MTDAEIKKALECHCHPVCCIDCPMHNREHDNCVTELWSLSLDLINRQQAEIERLTERNFELAEKGEAVCIDYKTAKAEAIKEFVERLKPIVEELVDMMWDDEISKCQIKGCRYPSNIPCGNKICIEENTSLWIAKIDNLVKEMVGDAE